MKQLNTALMKQPAAYQCSFRINQLVEYYGKIQCFKTMLSPSRLSKLDELSEIERHVLNLYLTHGSKVYFEVFNLIFKSELKKVG